jgi:hypothetical protein
MLSLCTGILTVWRLKQKDKGQKGPQQLFQLLVWRSLL